MAKLYWPSTRQTESWCRRLRSEPTGRSRRLHRAFLFRSPFRALRKLLAPTLRLTSPETKNMTTQQKKRGMNCDDKHDSSFADVPCALHMLSAKALVSSVPQGKFYFLTPKESAWAGAL